jgi:uncharacterized protein
VTNYLAKLAVSMMVLVLRLYQVGISPLLGPSKCRYNPTCSSYGIDALRKHGVRKGIVLTVKRVFSCRPGGGQGYDPVP